MESSLPDLSPEFIIKTSRSGGKGGQNVNKVSSKAEVHFNLLNSSLLPENLKEKLVRKLKNKLTREGEIIVVSQTARSQYYNKKEAILKLYKILENGLKEKKARKATKPSSKAKEKRLREKKILSEKKKHRQEKRNRLDLKISPDKAFI